MNTIVKSIWIVLGIGGIGIWYWFMDGSWQTHGDTLLEHDIVRFGPIPMFLSFCWGFLFLVALLLTCKGWSSKTGLKK